MSSIHFPVRALDVLRIRASTILSIAGLYHTSFKNFRTYFRHQGILLVPHISQRITAPVSSLRTPDTSSNPFVPHFTFKLEQSQ